MSHHQYHLSLYFASRVSPSLDFLDHGSGLAGNYGLLVDRNAPAQTPATPKPSWQHNDPVVRKRAACASLRRDLPCDTALPVPRPRARAGAAEAAFGYQAAGLYPKKWNVHDIGAHYPKVRATSSSAASTYHSVRTPHLNKFCLSMGSRTLDLLR
ncbi:hypothetical protein B0H15DRAFT_952200 [Mycena belliarum]|uniref:Glutaminase A central domain-containing protein n=1 Tax=Mycena belliarum TaxID=1033014 RepID=A0AAD6TXQ4_9AGAR|nr:hypothetical protein B0H15DRAFT_952200 [Mycena belliae]